MRRFFLLFVSLQLALFAIELTAPVQQYLVLPWTALLAQACVAIVTQFVAEADPAHYTYGLPLFAALLLAARSRQLFKKLVLGYVLLLLPQTFSLVFEILRQIMVAGGSHGALHITQWQMEAIAMGYQVGSLLLPTLASVVLWLWLERSFFAAVLLDGWIRHRMKNQK